MNGLYTRWASLSDVVAVREGGMLEGCLKGESGVFPSQCVREPPPTIPTHRRNSNRSIKHFATAPRNKKQLGEGCRTVVLHRGRRGFGFVLRGAKATSPLVELPHRCPALQYLDDVDEKGVADMAGLKKGDFLLAINGEDVSMASHEHVVDLIRRSGDLVSMTVVSCNTPTPTPDPQHYATLPRKPASAGGTLGRSAPLPPRRDPKTTLTVGRARARSMVVSSVEEDGSCGGKSSSAESLHQPRTASIRARPTSSRITAAELEEMFARQTGVAGQGNMSQPSSPARTPRVYASVAEMKRNKSKLSGGRVRFSTVVVGTPGGELHREFHSTPDLAGWMSSGPSSGRPSRSQEELRPPLPPPDHPPPPPPPLSTQIVKVDLNKDSDYSSLTSNLENVAITNGTDTIKSSFKPSNNAKLYASPEDIQSVAFRSRTLSREPSRPMVRKSQSLRSTSTTFKPESGTNPYAQPMRSGIPPIPDPDYSLSEGESDTERRDKGGAAGGTVVVVRGATNGEGSGNSSSSGGSIAVEEIQRVRSGLRASKSYPSDFLDGDNSSSGVSSDQEVGEARPKIKPTPVQTSSDALLPPPPEFDPPPQAQTLPLDQVFAPPPQFSDGKLVTCVRIVSSVSKPNP